ncbi:MAG: pantoate--beta-alanine ligase [Proteobacteria bacterium TMED51]|jgi:pantoate--beta-alanine ligase|nr:MAG: pantoate--beta-alanine ligase [Proteobacteria bacterium TMED51]HBP85789.1 pantoate--beta-alanine ligase [Gammaproteobacteria bacterium]HCL93047.1 pantoate--beta-alanine ligase [Gammaproteobacteria bacterium]|tara:strand:- start:1618 stop:2475 length:858 start_codon:yes stop_codon:yes gene_type:complete
MLHLESPTDAKRWCTDQRSQGKTLGFVPTMGALHKGHLSLVTRARTENGICCASIFINPLQFEDQGDFDAYPRDKESDLALLEAEGCDMVFMGSLEEFFPEFSDLAKIDILPAGPHGSGLEEQFRPGHLDGVRTIVERLFCTVGPSSAYFGEKDFQQTLVVSDLAREMGYPTIVVCPTVREDSGLALSSRNVRLSPDEKNLAHQIYPALLAARDVWQSGERTADRLSAAMTDHLNHDGLIVEYAEVRDPAHWTAQLPQTPLERAQALIAVRIGSVRLIDNLRLDR